MEAAEVQAAIISSPALQHHGHQVLASGCVRHGSAGFRQHMARCSEAGAQLAASLGGVLGSMAAAALHAQHVPLGGEEVPLGALFHVKPVCQQNVEEQI